MAARRKKKKRKPNKFAKGLMRLFFWVLGIIGVLILILVGIAAFYEEGIGKLVVQELKKSLKSELEIETAELSLIWNFPQASVTLKNVKLRDTGSDTTKYLLTADDLSLKCGMFGLLSGSYKFTSIDVNNASVYVHYDKNGNGNFDIFKSSEEIEEETNEESKLDLSIESTTLTNVVLHYLDEKAKQEVKMKVKSSFFSGDFTNEKYDMTSYANIVSEYIRLDEDVYLKDKELGYNVVINIDNVKNTYSFKEVDVSVEANTFKTNGSVSLTDEGTKMDINFKSDQARLGSLLKLLPKSFEESLAGFESNAKMKFDAKVEGLYSEKSLPMIDVSFGLKRGRVTHPSMKSPIKGVGFDIHFMNKGGKSRDDALFELKNFKGSLAGNPISLNLVMEGLDNPSIDFNFNGTVPLKAVYGLLGEQVSKGTGDVAIDKLYLEGRLNDMLNPRRISRVKLGGIINFRDAGIVMNDVPLQLREGKLELKDRIFSIENLYFKSQNTDIQLEGNFINVLPVIFADSVNSQKAELGFRAGLKSDRIDADELIKAFSTDTDEAVAEARKTSKMTEEEVKDSILTEKNKKREHLTQFLQGAFKISVGEFKYRKIRAQNFRGEIAFENNVMKVKGMRMNAFEGEVGLNAKVHFEEEPYLLAFFDCSKVDMRVFMEQMENFGQETIMDKHLRGQLSSVVKINAFWDEKGNFLDEELVVIADVRLQNGEIIGMKMLEDFAGFIKLKELQHIKFTDLRNQFRIQNREFHMPAMFIQSSVVNLTISGKHRFDETFTYYFKVNAGQALAQKFKKAKAEIVPARRKGLFNIYAYMDYNPNSTDKKYVKNEGYFFKIGKKRVKPVLEKELNTELGMVANTLRAEFEKSDMFAGMDGVSNRVTSLKEPEEWSDIPEYEGGDPDEEPEYIDWE